MKSATADPEQLLELIDKIYSAACDPKQWVPMAHAIQSAIGGHCVNFALEDLREQSFSRFYTNGVNSSDVNYYEQNIIGRDDFNNYFDNTTPNTALLSQQYWDERELHNHYPYEEFYESRGYSYFNASLFYHDGDQRGWLSVVRSLHDPLFTETDWQLMQNLTPHLHRAFLINRHLFEAHQAQQMCLDTLEHLSSGVILLSGSGRLVHCNSRAKHYLRAVNNLKQDFRVRLPDRVANRMLQQAIAEVLYANHDLTGRFIPFRESEERHLVLCLPWRMNERSYAWLNQQVGCVLFILGAGPFKECEDKLIAAFDVSHAEARVLMGIINGLTSEKLAEQLCVSSATVRFHIKNLLRKFAAHNQVEMLAKVDRCLNVDIG